MTGFIPFSNASNRCFKMSTKSKTQPIKRLLGHYEHDGFFDEMLDAEGRLRPHYRQFRELFQTLTPREFEHKRQSVDLAFLRQGITFNVYGDSAGRGEDFPVRPAAAHHSGQGMGISGARPGPAHHGAEPVPARHLSRAENPEGRRHPAVLRPVGQAFPARVRELQCAQGHLHPRLRHGPDPRRRGQLPGAGRQRPLSQRRQLRAGKPPGDEAHVSRRCSRASACGRWSIIRRNC